MNRTTTSAVTFSAPFTLGASKREYPAGSYRIETDEERLEGLSFHAYRRTSVRLHVPEGLIRKGASMTVIVSPKEFDEAVAHDAAALKLARPTVQKSLESAENEGLFVPDADDH